MYLTSEVQIVLEISYCKASRMIYSLCAVPVKACDPFFTFYCCIACKNDVFNWTFLLRINTRYSVKSKAKWHLPPELMHLKVEFLFCSQAKLPRLHQAPLWIVISVIPQLLKWVRFRLWLTQFMILNICFLQTQHPKLTASGKNMATNIYYCTYKLYFCLLFIYKSIVFI